MAMNTRVQMTIPAPLVLKLPKKVAGGVIRLSFGPETTREDIDACAAALRRHHDTRFPRL